MKVAIVYPYLALYRRPVFKCLMTDKDIEYTIISDIKSNTNIKTIDSNELTYPWKYDKIRWLSVKNIWLGNRFLWQMGLLKKLKSKKYDFVIFLGTITFLSTWIALFYLKLKKRNVGFWTHGLYGRESFLIRKIRVLFYNLGDVIFTYNNRSKKLLEFENILSNKIIPIYNSLDYNFIESIRKSYMEVDILDFRSKLFKNEGKILFFIGRLMPSKGLDQIVYSLKELNSKNKVYNFIFIGDGPMRKELNLLIKKNNLEDKFLFTGSLYDENIISKYILSSNLCVCPGAIGLTAIHSMSYGVPVVTNDDYLNHGPEFEAIIPEKTGAFYLKDNCQSLIDTIIHMTEDIDSNYVRLNCLQMVKNYYNPSVQANLISMRVIQQIKHNL